MRNKERGRTWYKRLSLWWVAGGCVCGWGDVGSSARWAMGCSLGWWVVDGEGRLGGWIRGRWDDRHVLIFGWCCKSGPSWWSKVNNLHI